MDNLLGYVDDLLGNVDKLLDDVGNLWDDLGFILVDILRYYWYFANFVGYSTIFQVFREFWWVFYFCGVLGLRHSEGGDM